MIEYRNVTGAASASGDSLVGQVTPFNSKTTIGNIQRGGFHEQIAPGAFTKTLQERDIVLLWNHNTDFPLARTSAGNLSLSQDGSGLQMRADPVDTSYGSDLMKLAKAGVVKGMSFGFEVVRDSWTDRDGNPSDETVGLNRTVHEVKLHEVSAVTFPAYADTALSARSELLAKREERAEKYNADDRKKAASAGQAMPDGSFPIKDAEDLANAIHLAGNAKDPVAARKHIIARAKALGLSSKIPATWNSDGTIKEANSAVTDSEQRDTIDGDDPNGEFYSIWHHGAICDLEKVVGTGQLEPNLEAAVKMILAFRETLVSGQGSPDAPTGPDYFEKGAAAASGRSVSDDEVERMRLTYQYLSASVRA